MKYFVVSLFSAFMVSASATAAESVSCSVSRGALAELSERIASTQNALAFRKSLPQVAAVEHVVPVASSSPRTVSRKWVEAPIQFNLKLITETLRLKTLKNLDRTSLASMMALIKTIPSIERFSRQGGDVGACVDVSRFLNWMESKGLLRQLNEGTRPMLESRLAEVKGTPLLPALMSAALEGPSSLSVGETRSLESIVGELNRVIPGSSNSLGGALTALSCFWTPGAIAGLEEQLKKFASDKAVFEGRLQKCK